MRLRRHGPLWVTTESTAKFSIHGRVVKGIRGDGTAVNTTFQVIDPGTGIEVSETVQLFMERYEKVPQLFISDTVRSNLIDGGSHPALAPIAS